MNLFVHKAYFEVVNGDKVREERQDVLNFEAIALVQKLHGLLDVFLLLNHMSSWYMGEKKQM